MTTQPTISIEVVECFGTNDCRIVMVLSDKATDEQYRSAKASAWGGKVDEWVKGIEFAEEKVKK